MEHKKGCKSVEVGGRRQVMCEDILKEAAELKEAIFDIWRCL